VTFLDIRSSKQKSILPLLLLTDYLGTHGPSVISKIMYKYINPGPTAVNSKLQALFIQLGQGKSTRLGLDVRHILAK
jgi:hypothetical protein